MSDQVKRKKFLARMRTRRWRDRQKLKSSSSINAVIEVTSSDSDEIDSVEQFREIEVNDMDTSQQKDFIEGYVAEYGDINVEDQPMGERNVSSEDETESRSTEELMSDINENNDFLTSPPEISQIRVWAIANKIPHAHLSPLLQILRARLLPGLPKSATTFLRTNSARYHIEPMTDGDGSMGEFCYLGIQKGLENCIDPNSHDLMSIKLQINADGMSISKSSSKHMWPILCKVYSNSVYYEAFVVALYTGSSKPKNANDYLREFIRELNFLLAEGITIGNKHFPIEIQCFIADTPARAFLKGTQGHAGFHACERCTVIGFKDDKTTCFPETNCNPRSDESFRNIEDPDHHTYPSPLLFITPPINMIASFVLDFMHLGFLGITAKLLAYWFLNTSKMRVSAASKVEVSRRLKQLKSQIPTEFHRKIRTVAEFTKYKATELKFFALYAGPLVLKNIFSAEVYENFLSFHIASRLSW